ncbi:MAG: RluA family pseudouridine synthase, partial [Candidatus Omnitrophica bacterium]|nr:RluA family pseudouridine synthase [Candidatus Omnitrophota bacterium]
YKVAVEDQIEINMNEEVLVPEDIKPEKMELDIIYEDEALAVLNKPQGITVHPANSFQGGTLVNGLIYHYKELSDVNGPVRPGIVHRLDKETSGLIVIAKNNVAHARLGRQFEKHKVQKRYVARVEGCVQFDQGLIEVPLERHEKYHDMRQVAQEGEGKEAITAYQVIKRFTKSTLVALFPETGRTHQLRVHMKHLGHPILGDAKYGRKDTFPRLALHAENIIFMHPMTKEQVEFTAPVPEEFLQEKI